MKILWVLAILVCFASQISCAPPPQLTTYSYELDLTNLMADTTPAINDIPTPTYYHFYWKIVGDTINMGIVCNGSASTGNNDYSYCGFGLRISPDSTTGMIVSDAFVGFVDIDNNNVLRTADLHLNGRNLGLEEQCKAGFPGIICPDNHRPTASGCKDDILTGASGYRENEYLVLEWSRKLSTGDATCDKAIVPGTPQAVVFSIGVHNPTATWPYGLTHHTHAANVLVNNYFVTFDRTKCDLPGGGTLNHGASQTFYQAATVPCTQSCVSQTRTCTDGVLNGTFTATACTVDPCRNCNGPGGEVVTHGNSVTFYSSPTVPCGGNCATIGQQRTCTDGTLSGTFQNPSCTVDACQNCQGPDGTTIVHGNSKDYFQTATVVCTTTCQKQSRVCNDGTLSGTFQNPSCTVDACRDCTGPDSATIVHGDSKVYYLLDVIAACGTACNPETRICTDGTLSGSHTFPDCTPASGCSDCTGPDGADIPDGTGSLYSLSSVVPCDGGSCQTQLRFCVDGNLNGTFTHPSCTQVPCNDCEGPDSDSIPHGQSKTYYRQASVSCESTCASVGESRACDDGTLSGTFTFPSCTVSGCTLTNPPDTTEPNERSDLTDGAGILSVSLSTLLIGTLVLMFV